MKFPILKSIAFFCFLLIFSHCKNSESTTENSYPSDILPHLDQWNLILGDGTNAGKAVNFSNEDFIYNTSDDKGNWLPSKHLMLEIHMELLIIQEQNWHN